MAITLGQMIKNKRNELGLSIVEAAKKIDVSKMTYVRLENDKTENISIINIVNVANSLNLDLFRMLKALNINLKCHEIETVFSYVRRIYYQGELLDNKKLEELIRTNLEELKSF